MPIWPNWPERVCGRLRERKQNLEVNLGNAVEFLRVSGLWLQRIWLRALMDSSKIGSISKVRGLCPIHAPWFSQSRHSRLFAHNPPLRTTAFRLTAGFLRPLAELDTHPHFS